MADKVVEVFSAASIADRLRTMGAGISAAYHGEEISVLAILDDSFVFLADLLRIIPGPLTTDFIRFDHQSHGNIEDISFFTQMELGRRNVLLVCGVLDTGVPQEYVIKQLEARGVASIKLGVLVDKPANRHVDITPDWKIFESNDEYVFGYGLGLRGKYRELPYLATIEGRVGGVTGPLS